MPISLKNTSGGSSFRASFFSGRLSVAGGASGDIISLTAPAGKRVRLTGLLATVGTESGITITCDGVDVVTNLTISNAQTTTTGSFCIGASTSTNLGQGGGSVSELEANSTIVITKLSGSIANSVAYSYAYGE